MREALAQSLANLRANRLRSVLTMFGIAWGMISVILLAAMGEGFRRGNQQVLEELGKNIAIVWGGRTSRQVGGERAGRRIILTVADARAIAEQASLVEVVSPELERNGARVKSRFNSASARVVGAEPQYQAIRTIDVEYGRPFNWNDERDADRVAIIGDEMARQLFGTRNILGELLSIEGLPYTVVGKIRKKDQDSDYNGRDNDKVIVPFATMMRDLPRTDAPPGSVSDIVVSPKPFVLADLPRVLNERSGRIEDILWPLGQNVRTVLAKRHGFEPDDLDAVSVWDTSIETLMFGRMVDGMRDFFSVVGLVTLALGGIGVMNIMLVAVKERTREIGVRKALGATTRAVQRQFFLEGFFLTVISGALGSAIALGLCALVNLLPMPSRFAGMILSWQSAAFAFVALVVVGVLTSTLPARRAAELPPVEALRAE
jgi:putative ABC transport system permease protein